MLLHLVPDTVVELGRQTGTRDMDRTAQPALLPGPSSSNTGQYSNTTAGLSAAATSASSNHTPDTVSQLHSKSGSIQSSWSGDRQAGMIAALSVQPVQRCRAILSLQLPVNQSGTPLETRGRPKVVMGTSIITGAMSDDVIF